MFFLIWKDESYVALEERESTNSRRRLGDECSVQLHFVLNWLAEFTHVADIKLDRMNNTGSISFNERMHEKMNFNER